MNVLFRSKFQILFVLLIILISCSSQKRGFQKDKASESNHDLLLKPIDIILGEEYEKELLVAINQETHKMGLYSSTGKEILPVIYDEIYSGLVNPYYVVVVQNRSQGLFNTRGKRICESIYNGFTFSPSDPSIISAYSGDQEKWVLINHKGKRIFSEGYTKIEFLKKDLVVLRNDEYKCSLASTKGELITEFEFEILQGLETNEMNEKWFIDNDIVATAFMELQKIFINSKGEVVDK